MLTILKYEIKYFWLLISVLFLLPIIFTIVGLQDLKFFTEVYFLKKYFWSVLIGLGIYGLVFMIWSVRKKEFRERVHAQIPVKLKYRSFTRWIFGVAPFLTVGIYIELLHGILPADQKIFISRINGQLGMMFVALAAFDLLLNSWYAFESIRYHKRILYSLLVALALLTFSIAVIYAVTTSFIKPLGFGGEELIFFLWGFILSIIGSLIFNHRKSFLG